MSGFHPPQRWPTDLGRLAPPLTLSRHSPSQLEHLTEPSDLAEADQGAGECCEGEMDVGSALVSDGQAAVAGQPGEGAFHDPAVSAEVGAAFDATSDNAWGDAAGAALLAAAPVIVGLVGVELLRSAAWAAPVPVPDGWDGVEGCCQHAAVVAVGAAQCQAKRRAPGIRDEVALGARLAAIRRVRPDFRTPLLAATLALSSAALRQSICPAAWRRSSSARCKAAQTPASCQSRSRR